jgi:hypothetical protein
VGRRLPVREVEMMGRLKGLLLILALSLFMVSCGGTLKVGLARTPIPAAGTGADVEATVQAAVEATLAAPGVASGPTADVNLEATVQAAVAATLAAPGVQRAPGEATYTEAQVWATAWAITEETMAAQAAMPQLLYSTYLGGDDFHDVHDIAVDGKGNAYVVGTTSARDLPTTHGAYDRLHNGETDVFVAKLSADGTRLLYGTYLGGSGAECNTGCPIAVDGAGHAFVTDRKSVV